MGLTRCIDIDPSQIVGVRVTGKFVFVEDTDEFQAMSISAKNLDAYRAFVTKLADALVTLDANAAAEADAVSLRDADAERELDWRAIA